MLDAAGSASAAIRNGFSMNEPMGSWGMLISGPESLRGELRDPDDQRVVPACQIKALPTVGV
jgi:hypothetical protein